MDDFELCGIETIARGVCIVKGMLLLCRAKGGATTYLPGGHIEFGETGREALVREIREELGVGSTTGRFLGCVENSFLQKGKRHAEINLVYELTLSNVDAASAASLPDVHACEDWIEFVWWPVDRLAEAHVLPAVFAEKPTGPFEP